jgi:multiple sugar transport system permease protein/sn-glycerol 3-phosphate transport system permease protein
VSAAVETPTASADAAPTTSPAGPAGGRRRRSTTTSGPGSAVTRRPLPLTIVQYVLLAAVLLLFVIPVYWLFSSSVKPESDIYAWPLRWLPTSIEWSNFAEAWNAAPFDRFFMNSIITTGVGTVLEMGCAVLSAYAFAFVRFRFKKAVFVLVLGSLMLPGHVTLLVNYITVGELGWLNTYAGLILPGMGSAFAMFLVYQQMRQVPGELIDAALVDGAGHLRRMLTLVVPLCKPMILTGTLIVLIGKWNDFVWPLIVTSTADMRTLPIGLMFLRSQEGYTNWGSILAGTVMVGLPMLVVFFVAQKRIMGGIAAGALKG